MIVSCSHEIADLVETKQSKAHGDGRPAGRMYQRVSCPAGRRDDSNRSVKANTS